MANNPYVNKVEYGGQTIIDLTSDTVDTSNLLSGETAHDRSGTPVTGTAKQGHVIENAAGTSMTQRSDLKFATAMVADENGKTVVRHVVQLTQAQYDALPASKLTDNIIYEITDGTSEQIQASDVGYNGSNVASALGLKADKAQISNPNLLDNPWFTVNQRGQSSYSRASGVGYCLDRWVHNYVIGVTVNADSTITCTNNTSGASWITQRIDKSTVYKGIDTGETVTGSIKMANGNIHSVTGVFPTSEAYNDYPVNEDNIVKIRFQMTNTSTVQFVVYIKENSSATIKACKLERGSISTLALDTAPNYASELLKCQRYFQRIGTDDSHTLVIGSGHCYGTYLMFNTFLPVPMRTNPALTVNGGVSACRININGSSKVVTSFSGVSLTNNIISMLANTASDIGLNSYAGDVHIRAESGNTLSLNFTADL